MGNFGVRLAQLRFGSIRYNSPFTQVFLLGFVCFCSVGMFSAINNLGAGGLQTPQLNDEASSVLYGVFAVAGLFMGSVANLLGPRLSISLGTTGYSLYIGGLWAHQTTGVEWFLILAGGILGLTAALLWAAQGSVMMSYPLEKDKGRAFSLFWTLFQLGTLVGASISLGLTAHSTLPGVSTGVYLAFMIIMLTAIVSAWTLLPPHLVVRGDGTVVDIQKALTPREEIKAFIAQFKDWRMLALFPMFFSSNYFYSYQGAITTVLFNGRTRSLGAVLTGLGSIVGSIFIGFITDHLPVGRRKRALIACVVVILFNIMVWSGGLALQLTFTRADDPQHYDWTDGKATGPLILLLAYYIADAMFQGLAYYTMSAITNDPYRLARMAGYYKGVQSAGAAVSFGMDAVETPYLTEHLVSWLMLLLSLPLCFLVLWKCTDTNYDTEKPIHVEDLTAGQIEGVALPTGHHLHAEDGQQHHNGSFEDRTDEKDVGVL